MRGGGRDLGVRERRGERRDYAVEGCALDRDWSVDAEQQDAGDRGSIAVHPFGAGEWRKYSWESSTRRLMAAGAAAREDLTAVGRGGCRGLGRGRRGLAHCGLACRRRGGRSYRFRPAE